jgi:hypothetical protein
VVVAIFWIIFSAIQSANRQIALAIISTAKPSPTVYTNIWDYPIELPIGNGLKTTEEASPIQILDGWKCTNGIGTTYDGGTYPYTKFSGEVLNKTIVEFLDVKITGRIFDNDKKYIESGSQEFYLSSHSKREFAVKIINRSGRATATCDIFVESYK